MGRHRGKDILRDEVSMKFLRSLKAERLKRGMSQKELAGILGVTRNAVSFYESGKALPSLPVLMRLAEIFGADLSDSLNWKYHHRVLNLWEIRAGLKRYAFSFAEIGRMLKCEDISVGDCVKLGIRSSLKILSGVIEILEDERRREKFRISLLGRGKYKRRSHNA